ncbi:MAG TPA: hypothetical protein VNW97_10915 [Candidatus Saccharimonadales bacterium]|jgi:hypothetical protein|nr:hypothetical protein [Candidatus Saccharimonadales bacterium]
MQSKTILIYTLLWLVSAYMQAQEGPSLHGALAEQGKPVSGAMVILEHMKDERCARIFSNKNPSRDDQEEFWSCEEEIPRTQTDKNGHYSYPHLVPGWYNIRFWWLMSAPLQSNYSVACQGTEWTVMFVPGKELTGKYDGSAQDMPFELKAGDSRQIDFDYGGQLTGGTNCITMGGAGFTNPKSANPEEAQISIPGVKGILSLATGSALWQAEFMPQNQQVKLRTSEPEDGLQVVAFLQKAPFAANAERCRDARWPKDEKRLRDSEAKLESLQQSSRDGMALVEAMVRESQESKLFLREVHAYWGRGNLCAEVQLSKVDSVPGNQKLFDEVLASVKFLPEVQDPPR